MRRLLIVAFASLVVLAGGLGLRQGQSGARAVAVGRSAPAALAHAQPLVAPRWLHATLVRQLAQVRRSMRVPVPLPAIRSRSPSAVAQGGTCYVSGTSCSLTPCDQFVGDGTNAPAVQTTQLNIVTVEPGARTQRPTCLRQPARPASGPSLAAGGSVPIGFHPATAVAVR